jgi:hypothetical protein
MSVPWVGPSYTLRSRTADVQRTVNMIPLPLEPGNERSGWRFKDIPGLVVEYDIGGGAYRGGLNNNGRVFVVVGQSLIELLSNGTTTSRGTLGSTTGNVGMVANTTQLVFSDAASLYVLTLATNVLTSTPFNGKARIDYINQLIVFVTRDTQQFGWTALGDATSIDALDFASAESSPDNLVSLIVDHRELLLLGQDSIEDWLNTTSTAVFERNPGVAIEEGIASEFCVAKLDSSVYWLTSSSRGQGKVVRLQGYVPTTISTQAIEEKLTGLDLSGATAYAYEMEDSKFYCLNVPGLDTTLVYDAFTQQWHERAELVGGVFAPHRGTHHLFAFGKHLLGAADGKLYRLDVTASNNAGDPLPRHRVMPTSALPTRDRIKYDVFALSCDRGAGGSVAMRQSVDGGNRWGIWRTRSTGAIGKFSSTVQWKRMNGGRDIVVEVRCTDDVPFNPVQGGAK